MIEHALWDSLIRIKNGQLAKKEKIFLKKTRLVKQLLEVMWTFGYITGFVEEKDDTGLMKYKVYCKYLGSGEPVITNIRFLSTPGKKFSYTVDQLWKLRLNGSLIVLSTSKGLQSLQDCKKQNIGGEILFVVI